MPSSKCGAVVCEEEPMTPLLWFLLGAVSGAFFGVVVMAMLVAASEADDEIVFTPDDWYHQERFTARHGVGNGANPERQLWVRRGPYNWENES
jgi:hypothetical protein